MTGTATSGGTPAAAGAAVTWAPAPVPVAGALGPVSGGQPPDTGPPDAADLADPATRLARWRLVRIALSVAMVALPLLRPTGPGNTGLVDVALLLAIFASLWWASTRAYRLRMPYAWPVALSVLAGSLAAAISSTPGEAGRGLLALVQDLFVLAWAAAVATVGRDRRLLDTLCRAWAYSATFWAAVMIVADALGIDWLAGVTARDGIRASLTLGDPNLAADYFLVSLLILRATRRPRRAAARWFAAALLVTAVVLTLSNGGILAMIVATALGWLFGVARRRGVTSALALAAVLALVAGVAASTVNIQDVVARTEQASPLVRDSLGRQAESGGSRSTLLHEGLSLWLHGGNPLGIGPNNTKTTLQAGQAPYVKEAHDDYLAALLERGVVGGAALVLLIAAVTVRARRIARPGGVAPAYLAVVPRPELLGAAVAAVALSAMFYGTLHFRHVWTLFGLIAALELTGGRRAGRTPDAGSQWRRS